MPEHISEVIRRMREKAAANPDFVYEKVPVDGDMECVYFEGGDAECPSCLVGHGIAPIVPPGMFRNGIFSGEMQTADKVIDDLAELGALEYDTDTQIKWVSEVQAFQDRGMRWARCIAEADDSFPLEGQNA